MGENPELWEIEDALSEVIQRLDAAEDFGGFYDGWGCGIVK